MSTTPVDAPATTRVHPKPQRLWRVVRLHLVAPSVLVGIPCLILASAWAVSMLIGVLVRIAAGTGAGDSMRYSWAVLSPQWYLGVVGVQAIALTFQYALGLGSTRRDYWLGTLWVFGLVALGAGILFATLVQVEIVTGGWGLDIRMFDALWYGLDGWWVDAYSTAALSFTVLALGATAATVYMRWRMIGVVLTGLGLAVLLLGIVAVVTLTDTWPSVLSWFGSLRIAQAFTLLLALGALLALAGHAVIRRATPRG
ncbi:MAG: hypothetical protein ACOYBY_07110 [Dermatophilaceae bacterium]